MRWWLLPMVLACSSCSKKSESPPERAPSPEPAAPPRPAPPPRPARLPANAGSTQLGEPCGPVATANFVGSWVGARPFDNANPMAHRGPTTVTLTLAAGKVHYSEGVGSAGTEVDLDIDPAFPNYALGKLETTKDLVAASLDDGKHSSITITKIAELAICIDERDQLHVGRRLAASGQGIQSQDESDVVILDRGR